ncbi:alpha/beta hydrolase [Hahella sp. HN01]|uniref:alpha/beta hydrolase n=1 Tax=Hahella sp. HN01 TaxID=2847262 RepID=UPI001C1EF3A9|nr:alpha/beta hydrolase [Hahella sp. HN01]MBU6955379.1 alpha/beta hydrolase [Hahella sp. HN01]
MLNDKAQAALKGWINAAGPIGDKLLGVSEASWAEVRSHYMNALNELFPVTEKVDIEPVNMGGVAGIVVTPEKVLDNRTLLYIHGGGYVHGGIKGYEGLAARYATWLGARVYVPDYRQAPEHVFPTPVNDVFTAYRYLLESGVAPQSLALSGDSAGGAMVITTMIKARNAGLPQPVAGAALSPWANLTHSGASAQDRDGLDPLVTVAMLKRLARTFLGDALATDPDASPVFADVRGIAPTLIQIGENEVMLSDAIRLASHLGENRVRVNLEVWPGMFHVWHLFSGFMPEAAQALMNAVNFLDHELTQAKNR